MHHKIEGTIERSWIQHRASDGDPIDNGRLSNLRLDGRIPDPPRSPTMTRRRRGSSAAAIANARTKKRWPFSARRLPTAPIKMSVEAADHRARTCSRSIAVRGGTLSTPLWITRNLAGATSPRSNASSATAREFATTASVIRRTRPPTRSLHRHGHRSGPPGCDGRPR